MASNPPTPRHVAPYEALAAGYDLVMEHVDYEDWAAYVHDLLLEHGSKIHRILELGCGTGSFAFELQELGPYEYVASDSAAPMVAVARKKARLHRSPIRFEVADFTGFTVEKPFDAVVLLHDGLNYLLEPAQIRRFLEHAYMALRPGGLLVFDQSTPANSINNETYFDDEGAYDRFSYIRRSLYDRARSLHTTTFELMIEGQAFHEEHVQRAYTFSEIRTVVAGSPFTLLGAYDDFSEDPATDASERIHWVLKRP